MTKKERREDAIKKLEQIIKGQEDHSDNERDHIDADRILIELINDPVIAELFYSIERWYA